MTIDNQKIEKENTSEKNDTYHEKDTQFNEKDKRNNDTDVTALSVQGNSTNNSKISHLCTNCSHVYSSKQMLQQHIPKCKGPRKDWHTCKFCGKHNKKASQLIRHMKTCKILRGNVHLDPIQDYNFENKIIVLR